MTTTKKFFQLASVFLVATVALSLASPAFGQVQEAWSVPVLHYGQSNDLVRSLFSSPLAVDGAGNVYVSVWESGRTVKLDANDGHELWPQPALFGETLAVDGAGNVYVSCNEDYFVGHPGPSTVKLDANDGHELWPQPAPFGGSLALDGAGNVYVSGWGDHMIGGGVSKEKLAANDGREVWLQPIPFSGYMVIDSAGGIYIVAMSAYKNWPMPRHLRKYIQTAINSLSPDSALAGGSDFTLTVNGFGFSSGSMVQWNGAPRETTFVSDTQLTAQISAGDISSLSDIATAEVTVTNLDGTTTPPQVFTIISAIVGTFESGVAGLGQSATVSTAPIVAGQSGVWAQASNSGEPAPLAVTVANYSANPTSGTVFDAGGGYLDVQVTGADTNDAVTSSFYYPSTITGGAEDNLALLYFNGSGWAQVLSSGDALPDKNTTDDLENTVSGGRFTVFFDNSSTPKVTELTGTVFAVADGAKPIIARVMGPNGPLAKGAAALLTVEYTATGGPETHPFSFAWGDGSTDTVVPSSYGTVSAAHTYGIAGVYTVTVTLTDASHESVTTRFEYVVVYDPDGGFVTGGGWINSPAGAYRGNTALNGKATFGFNSKYQKGATVPTGNTEFKLHFASFNFRSTDYQWLVVPGAKAQYKGSGAINGSGDYGFMLTATDGQLTGGGGMDKFRIKILDKATDMIVYDNAYGAADDLEGANPQVIAGGSIVIQKSK